MLSITKRFSFEAAHNLPHHEGKCKNLHGHNYVLDVTVTRTTPTETPRSDRVYLIKEGSSQGMLMDFGDLKTIMQPIIRLYDHTNLNDFCANTTAEFLILDFKDRIEYALGAIKTTVMFERFVLAKLRLYETPDCWVDWENPDVG